MGKREEGIWKREGSEWEERGKWASLASRLCSIVAVVVTVADRQTTGWRWTRVDKASIRCEMRGSCMGNWHGDVTSSKRFHYSRLSSTAALAATTVTATARFVDSSNYWSHNERQWPAAAVELWGERYRLRLRSFWIIVRVTTVIFTHLPFPSPPRRALLYRPLHLRDLSAVV